MSLVNEMLRDLEDRQDQGSTQPAGVSPVINRQHNPMSAGSKWSLSTGIALVAVALALWAWNSQWWQPAVEPSTLVANQDMAVPEPAAVVAETPAVIATPAEPVVTAKPMAEPVIEQIIEPVEQIVSATPAPVKKVEPATDKTVTVEKIAEPIEENTSVSAVEPAPPTPQQPLVEIAQAAQTITTSATTLDQQAVATARQLIEEGQTDRACSLLEEHLQHYPQASKSALELTLLKARTLLAQGQLEKAKGLMEQTPPAIEQQPDYHALLAGIYYKNGQHRTAAKLYSRLVKVKKNNSIYWLGLAVALDALSDTNALTAFRTTRSLNSNPDVQHYIEQRIAALSNKENQP